MLVFKLKKWNFRFSTWKEKVTSQPNLSRAKILQLELWGSSQLELITTAYHQDLWGISANVNNIFGIFITHYFTNLHLQIFWQFELILHLTIICLFLSNPHLLRAYNIGILNYIFLSKIFLNNHVGVHGYLLKSQRKVTGYCASIW